MVARFLRRLTERVLAPVVLTRNAPRGGGKLVISPAVGGLKYTFRSPASWDEELVRMAGLLVEPGARVWDVGANTGLFSVTAAHYASLEGAVLAF